MQSHTSLLDWLAAYRHAVAGAGGGLVTVSLLHPLDTIRTRMQAAKQASRAAPTSVQGGANSAHGVSRGGFFAPTLQALVSISRNEGIAAVYKGLLPAMVGNSVSYALYFHCFNLFGQRLEQAGLKPGPVLHLLAGTTAGIMTSVLTNPIWVLKTRLQLQRNHVVVQRERPYKHFADALGRTLSEEGFRGLYRGLGPSLWLVSHGAVQFATYAELKRVVAGDVNVHLSVPQSLLASTVSKFAASSVTYPLQVVRTRMQQRGADPKLYGTFRRAMATVFSREGVRGLYSGFTVNIIRVTPSAAITFVTYESIMKLLAP